MKLGIVGSRTFTDYWRFKLDIDKHIEMLGTYGTSIDCIVSGGAKGADALAEQYATEHGLQMVIHHPNWKAHGKAAGPIRNKLIVEEADRVIAFVATDSRGTLSTIDLCFQLGVQCEVIAI